MAQDDPPAVQWTLLCKPQTVVHHYRGYPLCVCVCVLKHVHSLYLPLQEIDANRLLVPAGEHALTVALNHAALSHRPVPHDHHLDGHLHILLQHLAAMLRGEIERCSQFTRLFLASASPAFG